MDEELIKKRLAEAAIMDREIEAGKSEGLSLDAIGDQKPNTQDDHAEVVADDAEASPVSNEDEPSEPEEPEELELPTEKL